MSAVAVRVLKAIGAVVAGLLFAAWALVDCGVLVTNPCPGLVDDFNQAYDAGDNEAAAEAVQRFQDAGCEFQDDGQ
jgi:hypothetical protein